MVILGQMKNSSTHVQLYESEEYARPCGKAKVALLQLRRSSELTAQASELSSCKQLEFLAQPRSPRCAPPPGRRHPALAGARPAGAGTAATAIMLRTAVSTGAVGAGAAAALYMNKAHVQHAERTYSDGVADAQAQAQAARDRASATVAHFNSLVQPPLPRRRRARADHPRAPSRRRPAGHPAAGRGHRAQRVTVPSPLPSGSDRSGAGTGVQHGDGPLADVEEGPARPMGCDCPGRL